MLKTAVLRRLRKEEKGFTLIELLAVIVILGVIAAIAIPLIGNIIKSSKDDSDIATARQIYDAARIYITSEENGVFKDAKVYIATNTGEGTDKTINLQDKGYLDKNITLPSDKSTISGGTVKFNGTGNLLYVEITSASGTIYYKGSEVLAGKGKPVTTAPTSP
ncbi:type II secretion system protein [Cohnella endophytica]|uniref:Type II secretion system protein n=1 Tax=Cohnella endophytica TaxID=2419778 RepID=A0A494Y4L6_9BACL|nr:type II secretion system protein [Cohnella endophytica]RKP57211.1 type II secretion system protein [Cohnella endophytica]